MREQDGRCRDQSPRWSGNGWSTLPRARRDKAARMLPTEPLIGTFNRNSYDAHIIPQSAAASFVYVTPSVRKPHPGPDAAWPLCATLPGGLAASYTPIAIGCRSGSATARSLIPHAVRHPALLRASTALQLPCAHTICVCGGCRLFLPLFPLAGTLFDRPARRHRPRPHRRRRPRRCRPRRRRALRRRHLEGLSRPLTAIRRTITLTEPAPAIGLLHLGALPMIMGSDTGAAAAPYGSTPQTTPAPHSMSFPTINATRSSWAHALTRDSPTVRRRATTNAAYSGKT